MEGNIVNEIFPQLYVGDLCYGDEEDIFIVIEDKIEKWNLDTLTKEQNYPKLSGHIDVITSLIMLENGQRFVSASLDSKIIIWDLELNKKIASLQGNSNGITTLSVTKNGKKLYSGGRDKSILVWDLENLKRVSELKGHTDTILCSKISQNENILITGGKDKKIIAWNLDTEVIIKELEANEGEINTLDITSDNKNFVSAGECKIITLWNLETFRKLREFSEFEDSINCLKFSPDGNLLVSAGSDSKIIVWNIKNGEKIKELIGHNDSVNSLIFFSENIFASAGSDRKVFLWDILFGERIFEYKGMKRKIWQIALSSDKKQIAVASSSRQIVLWKMICEEETILKLKEHKKKVKDVSFSPSGKRLASCSEDNLVILWDDKFEPLFVLKGHTNSINKVKFSPDEKILASCSDDKSIRFWDVETGKFLFKFENAHLHGIYAIDFYYSNKYKLFVSVSKNIQIWSILEKKAIKKLSYKEDIKALIFYDQGRKLISGCIDGKVLLWNIPKGKYKVLLNQKECIYSIQKSPDLEYLAIGGSGRDIIIFDLSVKVISKKFIGHERAILCLSFSKNGKVLASGSMDKTIILWDFPHGNKLQTLKYHKNSINGLDFSPELNILASASWDNSVAVFKDSRQFFYSHLFYKTLTKCDNKANFNHLIKNLNPEMAKKLISYYTIYPLNISLLNLICYLQNEKALQGFFQIIQKFNCNLNFEQDFFGNFPMQLALENPDLTKLVINFVFDNTKNIASSSLVTEEIFCKLLQNDFSQIKRLLDSRIVSPINFPKLSEKMDEDEIKTAIFKTKNPDYESYVKSGLVVDLKDVNQKSKIDIFFVDIPDILQINPKFLAEISQLESSHEIFSSKVLEYIIEHKWNRYAATEFINEGLIYLIFLIIFTVNSAYTFCKRLSAFDQGLTCEKQLQSVPIQAILGDFIIGGFLLMFLISEAEQVILYFKSNNFLRYISSPWNFIDWIVIITGISTIVIDLLLIFCIYNNPVNARIIHGISLFFVWINMIGFLRVFDRMSSMIRMILNVLYDSKFFIFLLFYICFIFSLIGKKKK